MLPENFIFIAAFMNLCSSGVYAYATLRGKTQPNRMTWFMWAVAPLITTAAQIAGGVGISTLFVFAVGLGPLVVFVWCPL